MVPAVMDVCPELFCPEHRGAGPEESPALVRERRGVSIVVDGGGGVGGGGERASGDDPSAVEEVSVGQWEANIYIDSGYYTSMG